MPAGQPPLDPVARARHWVWYSQVKDISGLSDDDLDRLFAGSKKGAPRPRAFHRVRSLGSSPKDSRGHQKTQTIYDAVHRGPHAADFELAKRTFESPLWELLANRWLPDGRIDTIIVGLVNAMGWTRIHAGEISTVRQIAGDDTVRSLGMETSARDTLAVISDSGSPDALALLCALYRQCVSQRELVWAVELHNAVGLCMARFHNKIRQPQWLGTLVHQLLIDRVLHDRWLCEADFRAEVHAHVPRPRRVTEGERRKEVAEFVIWYTSRSRKAGRVEDFGLPVPITPGIERIRRHLPALEAVAGALRNNESHEGALEDAPWPEWQEKAEVLAARSKDLRSDVAGWLAQVPMRATSVIPKSTPQAAESTPDAATLPKINTVVDVLSRMDAEDREKHLAERRRRKERRLHYFGTAVQPG